MNNSIFKRIKPWIYVLLICCLLGCIDGVSMKMKNNPTFCMFWYAYEEDYGTGATYLCPMYYVKVQDNGTSTIVDVKYSERVEIGLWFLPSFTIINE